MTDQERSLLTIASEIEAWRQEDKAMWALVAEAIRKLAAALEKIEGDLVAKLDDPNFLD